MRRFVIQRRPDLGQTIVDSLGIKIGPKECAVAQEGAIWIATQQSKLLHFSGWLHMRKFTQWVGAGWASGCQQAFQGIAHQPAAAAAGDFGSRPFAAVVRLSYSRGAYPRVEGYSTAGH